MSTVVSSTSVLPWCAKDSHVPVLVAPVTTESTVYLIFNQIVPIIDFHSDYTWFYSTTGKIIAAQGPQT